MNMELHSAKESTFEEVPDEAARELLKELDADRDGRISKMDFMLNAKKVLFDPNPPEEIAQMVEMMESLACGGMPLGGMPAPLAIMGPGAQVIAQPMGMATGVPSMH